MPNTANPSPLGGFVAPMTPATPLPGHLEGLQRLCKACLTTVRTCTGPVAAGNGAAVTMGASL